MVAPSLPSRAPVTLTSNTNVHVPHLGVLLPLLLDVPDAGALAGMSRWASYRAAADGTIPTLKVGNRLHVPTCAWLDRLGVRYEAARHDLSSPVRADHQQGAEK